jgi:membrane protease YdiL (CAAX protease family)
MDALKSFSKKRPILFVTTLVIVWFVLMMVFTGITAGILRRPYGDPTAAILGRSFVIICAVLLLWELGWLEASGITRLGSGQVWLFALGGLIYFTCASLYSSYGSASFDFSILTRLPASRTTVLTHFVVALNEEILFRGIVLSVLTRAWGKSTQGWIGSIVITSLLFAILHATQVFTDRLEPSSALFLVLGTFIVSIWWGVLVLAGGSIWPAVVLHFVGNAAVVVQGMSTPMLEPEFLVYERLMWFSLVLGVIGIGLLVQVAPKKTGWNILEI